MRLSRRRMFVVAVLLALPAAAVAVTWPAGAAETAVALGPDESVVPPLDPRVEQVGEERATEATLRYAGAAQQTSTEIRHPGAAYVKVHFTALRLAPGDYVTVADPRRREVHTYHGDPTLGAARTGDSAYTVHRTRGFAAMSIDGDTAVVTLHRSRTGGAAALDRSGHGVRIDRVWRGYSAAEIAARPKPLSVCGPEGRRDVVCYQNSHPTEFARSNAVARMLLGGGGGCTAWRVGRTNRLLTNNHCTATAAGVRASEVQFDFQCATCGGNNPRPGTKVSGAEFFRTSAPLDYTLFSVNNFAAIQQYGTLLLDVRRAVLGERIYIAGHGSGLPKRMSLHEDPQGTTACTVGTTTLDPRNIGYACDTTGGSSGSPVLAGSSHKVIALHHWGGCPNGGVRIDLIHNEIGGLIDNGDPGPGPGPGPRFENGTDVPIADLATAESPVTVSGVVGNAPSALRVEVTIRHTYRGDLILHLVAPDGTAYLLEDLPNGDSADDVVKTYTVNASAEAANGTWRLRVRDAAAQDVGRIDVWALVF